LWLAVATIHRRFGYPPQRHSSTFLSLAVELEHIGRLEPRLDGLVPSIYSFDRLTPRAAGTHDEAHQPEGRLPFCPGSAPAQYAARVRLTAFEERGSPQ